MNLLERLRRFFHEPQDMELKVITNDLNIEANRHYKESRRIKIALEEYEREEQERHA